MNNVMFHGYRVIENLMLTKTQTREVKRTWKERLFTLPWQPMKVTRTESRQVPDREVVVDKMNKIIYAHPVVANEIRRAVEKYQPHSYGFEVPLSVRSPKMDLFRGGV
jgi:hypothetical protein